MSRESVDLKARRLLRDGQLRVGEVHGGRVRATCRGDSADYAITREPGGRFRCDCPARAVCAHLRALALVLDPLESP